MKKIRFNDSWNFQRKTQGAPEKKTVQLPHDASIETWRDPKEPAGGANGFFKEENYRYTKDFYLNPEDEGKNVYLEFEGVYHNAFVYINGTFAGNCPHGYSNFYINATEMIKWKEKNSIQVEIKNQVPSSRWYTGGGIYRNVYLMIADRVHLAPDTARFTTVDCEEDLAVVEGEATVEHTGTGIRKAKLRMLLYDKQGEIAAQNTISMTVREHSREIYKMKLYVQKPQLWNVDTPSLYRYEVQLLDQETLADMETGNFGIRRLSLDPIHGLRINGKTTKLQGGCLHHDNGIIGAAEFSHAEQRRVQAMKAAGYNALRSSHYPMSRTLLDACDKYGMLVIDEFTDTWTSGKAAFDYSIHMIKWWEHDIDNMVRKDYNHPCVIMYSIGNEIRELGNCLDVQWGKRFADRIKALDPGRYITNGINILMAVGDQFDHEKPQMPEEEESQPNEINMLMNFLGANMESIINSDKAGEILEEACAHLDVVGYNYGEVRYETDREKYPGRIVMGTESYAKALDKNWELVQKNSHVLGDFSWTAWDYLGEAGIGKIDYVSNPHYQFFSSYPAKAAYVGDFDLLGERRPVSFWRERIWKNIKTPYLAVQPPMHHGEQKLMTHWCMTDAVRSWNFSGFEEKPVTVEVYTAAREAALYINGVLKERKLVGQEKKYVACFETLYMPGILEAVVYEDGEEAGRDQIMTAGAPHLEMEADVKSLPADGSDIGYIDFFLKDERGILNPQEEQKVRISIMGPGKIQGFGSAAPASEENYFDMEARTFQGRLRAVIRATGEPGEITVYAKAEDGRECSLILEAVALGAEKQ